MSTTTPSGYTVRDSLNNDQQVRGVLAGTDGHDAVNVDQLNAAQPIVCDGIAIGTVQLASVAVAGFTAAKLARVLSVRDFFIFDPTSTLAADGITVVTALGGTGRWLRLGLQDAFWQAQTQWSINFGSGNDENLGSGASSDAAPLKTFREWCRRVHGAHFSFDVVIRVLGSGFTDVQDGKLEGFTTDGQHIVAILGVPTVVRTGTLSSGTAAGTGNTAPIIEDTALASTWAAAGCVSAKLTGARLIRRTSGTACAGWIIKDLGTKQARVSWCASTTGSTFNLGQSARSFASGDTYEVLQLPAIPEIRAPKGAWVEYRLVEFANSDDAIFKYTGYSQFALCSFRSVFYDEDSDGVGAFVLNCAFLGSGGAPSQTILTPAFQVLWCALIGDGNSAMEIAKGYGSNWNAQVNTWQGHRLFLAHGAIVNRSGTPYFYDCSGPCITVADRAEIGLDAIKGEGNTDYLLLVRDAGCKGYNVANDVSGMTATTTRAKPFLIFGVEHDYADKVNDLNRQGGFAR